MAVRTASGEMVRGTRTSLYLVVSSEVFEREWAGTVAAFREEVAPAIESQRAAERRAEEARLAWDRTLTARGRTKARTGQWILTLRDAGAASSPPLWRSLQAAEAISFQAQKRVREITRRHEEIAHELVERHAIQRVQTDETGHYVMVKTPLGSAYLYARLRERDVNAVWLQPIQVQAGTQQIDLTQDNQRAWSLTP